MRKVLVQDSEILLPLIKDPLHAMLWRLLAHLPKFSARVPELQRTTWHALYPIENEQIVQKIHGVYRLRIIHDIVLADLQEDTFGPISALIRYLLVDILTWLSGASGWWDQFFGALSASNVEPASMRAAVTAHDASWNGENDLWLKSMRFLQQVMTNTKESNFVAVDGQPSIGAMLIQRDTISLMLRAASTLR